VSNSQILIYGVSGFIRRVLHCGLGGSTHAWCGVYLPVAGWVEYDPTNGLIAGANLIRVGVSREASQAIPISGGFVGEADYPIGMHVDVSVGPVMTG
jgi:transglutaminase-like putative cysteine protease